MVSSVGTARYGRTEEEGKDDLVCVGLCIASDDKSQLEPANYQAGRRNWLNRRYKAHGPGPRGREAESGSREFRAVRAPRNQQN